MIALEILNLEKQCFQPDNCTMYFQTLFKVQQLFQQQMMPEGVLSDGKK